MIKIIEEETANDKGNMKLRIRETDERLGFWQYIESEYDPDGFFIKCSECGYDTAYTEASKKCPNCGARMRY